MLFRYGVPYSRQEQLRSGNRVSLNFLDKNYSLMAIRLNRESGPTSVPERAVSSLRAQLNIERIMVDAMNYYSSLNRPVTNNLPLSTNPRSPVRR